MTAGLTHSDEEKQSYSFMLEGKVINGKLNITPETCDRTSY